MHVASCTFTRLLAAASLIGSGTSFANNLRGTSPAASGIENNHVVGLSPRSLQDTAPTCGLEVNVDCIYWGYINGRATPIDCNNINTTITRGRCEISVFHRYTVSNTGNATIALDSAIRNRTVDGTTSSLDLLSRGYISPSYNPMNPGISFVASEGQPSFDWCTTGVPNTTTQFVLLGNNGACEASAEYSYSIDPAVQTLAPSSYPSAEPSLSPSSSPSRVPSAPPSWEPSSAPSESPSVQPSGTPSLAPSTEPSVAPSNSPTTSPSLTPTTEPTTLPTGSPTSPPTLLPTAAPTEFDSCQLETTVECIYKTDTTYEEFNCSDIDLNLTVGSCAAEIHYKYTVFNHESVRNITLDTAIRSRNDGETWDADMIASGFVYPPENVWMGPSSSFNFWETRQLEDWCTNGVGPVTTILVLQANGGTCGAVGANTYTINPSGVVVNP